MATELIERETMVDLIVPVDIKERREAPVGIEERKKTPINVGEGDREHAREMSKFLKLSSKQDGNDFINEPTQIVEPRF